jgi:hypothetical protein
VPLIERGGKQLAGRMETGDGAGGMGGAFVVKVVGELDGDASERRATVGVGAEDDDGFCPLCEPVFEPERDVGVFRLGAEPILGVFPAGAVDALLRNVEARAGLEPRQDRHSEKPMHGVKDTGYQWLSF